MHQISLETDIMGANEEAAAHNREMFERAGIAVVNFMSAPGAGKTSLLERTIEALKPELRIGVIEGDLMTTIDADRIAALGVPSHQITTGTVCHLDAKMVHNSLHNMDIKELDLLIIENVGNLVCPAEFNLGEDLRVMVYSTVEGAEKPKKYPVMFHMTDAVVLNKIDLLPYSGVSFEELRDNVRDVNPDAPLFPVSCRTGEGIDKWIAWFGARIGEIRRKASAAAAIGGV